MSATAIEEVAEDTHELTLVSFHEDPVIADARLDEGVTCYRLDEQGRTHLLPDDVAGVCSCGEVSDWMPTWQEARWWCRGHRTSLGLPWQQWLSEIVVRPR